MSKKEIDPITVSIKNIKNQLKKLTTEISCLKNEINRKDVLIEQLKIRRDELNRISVDEEKKIKDLENKITQIIGKVNIDAYLCGLEFEKHVVFWMCKECPEYKLKIWQGDKVQSWFDWNFGKQIASADWNKYPDLIFVNYELKKVLAIECKYRKEGLLFISKEKYQDYLRFQENVHTFMNVDVETYIMVGVGGENSSRPQKMYCIPLEEFDSKHNYDTNPMNMEDNYQFRVMYRTSGGKLTTYYKNIPY